MILSNKQIIQRWAAGDVVIEPFDPRHLGTSSYDVTLGEWYYEEHHRVDYVYNIWDFAEVREVWGEPRKATTVTGAGGVLGIPPGERIILLEPGHTILAHTREFIGGRRNLTTMMKARSSYGRNFIEVCKCAGLGDVGYVNRWTMEITNNSRFHAIPLVVGRRIAQIVFMETGELLGDDYTARGKYQTATDTIDSWSPEMMLPRLDKEVP